MITLRVVLDDLFESPGSESAVYAEELTRAIIATAPDGCVVEGAVAASTETQYGQIAQRLPGLATLHKSALARREQAAAWRRGLLYPAGSGMLHSPGLLAPLARHDRLNRGDQVAVTVIDTLAWSESGLVPARSAALQHALLKRAERFADGVVVPSHAVAEEVADLGDFGDRIRVISGGRNTRMRLPHDAADRRRRLDLPDRYVIVRADAAAIRDLAALADAASALGELPLVIVGDPRPDYPQQLLSPGITTLADPDESDLAAALSGAAVFVCPGIPRGTGMSMLDAFALGTPVIHTDRPAHLELAADAGLAVRYGQDDGYPARLTGALAAVLDDEPLAERMALAGQDRARAYGWLSSAEKVWQLHADL